MLLTKSLFAPSFLSSLLKKCRPSPAANISLSSPLAATSTAKTVEEQVGLPPKPKKPITPYFRFMREMRPKVKENNPGISTVDVVRQLSKQWQTADVGLKDRLQAEYKKAQEQYLQQRVKYDSNITDEQKAEIKQLKQAIVDMKERRALRKKVAELGKPKRPTSGYLRFMIRERAVTPQNSEQSYRDWHQKATAKWARMSDSDKQVFIQQSRKEMEKYKKEVSLWEEKMMRLGHMDVVRHSNLIDPPEAKPKKR